MHKFIRSNKNPNSHVYVCDYNWPVEVAMRGRAMVVRVNCLEDINAIQSHLDEATKVEAFVYRNDFESLETIDINPAWGNTAIILYINRLGQFRNVHHKVDLIRRMNMIVIFTGNEAQVCEDAQILASLGIHTGIELRPDSELSDHVLDLITYNFYGTMPHGQIEPFSAIERNYDGESYVSPELTNFINPYRYIHVDKDLNLAFSKKALENGEILSAKMGQLKPVDLEEEADKYAHKWQEMFVDSHECTFCPAFRTCMGYFKHEGEGKRCKTVMTELLDAIEFFKLKLQQNNNQRCQL